MPDAGTAIRRAPRAFGPWIAWIGRNGMAPPGAKRGRRRPHPSGTFGFGFFFGVDPNPAVLPILRWLNPPHRRGSRWASPCPPPQAALNTATAL
jgi:hypothetical protein